MNWIEEELRQLQWDHPELVAYLAQHPEFQPRRLLAILIWSYATGVFESKEVREGCTREPSLRKVSGDQAPSEEGLETFRKWNLGLIRWGLLQLYRKAFRIKYNVGSDWFPPGLNRLLSKEAQRRVDIARQMDRSTGSE